MSNLISSSEKPKMCFLAQEADTGATLFAISATASL